MGPAGDQLSPCFPHIFEKVPLRGVPAPLGGGGEGEGLGEGGGGERRGGGGEGEGWATGGGLGEAAGKGLGEELGKIGSPSEHLHRGTDAASGGNVAINPSGPSP